MITEKQHQEWKRDLEELHSVKAENEKLKEEIGCRQALTSE